MTNDNNTVLYTGVTSNLKTRLKEHKEKLQPGRMLKIASSQAPRNDSTSKTDCGCDLNKRDQCYFKTMLPARSATTKQTKTTDTNPT